MAFYGSAMGVTGGAVELVGLVMEKGAQQIIDANRLAARGMGTARDITRVGNVLVRTGATMVAAAGMYDAAQAGMAAARTWQNGDSEALRAYSVSTVGFAIGSALGMSAGATGALTLMGPLGWALIFGMLSYGIFKWAEDLESTPLEIWARRSFFGHHNETPPIHWYQPEDADRAIAALNAVTLGIYVDLSFQLQLRGIDSHSASGVLGVPGSPRQELYLEYSLRLPYFNQDRSAYRWTLTIHRKGSSHLDNAEADVLTRSNFGTPRLRQNVPFGHRAANPPSASQASSDELKSKVAKGQLLRENLDNNRTLQTKCYKGSIDLMNYDQNKNIERADLVLSYWPDCDIADGYIEVNIATINPHKLSR